MNILRAHVGLAACLLAAYLASSALAADTVLTYDGVRTGKVLSVTRSGIRLSVDRGTTIIRRETIRDFTATGDRRRQDAIALFDRRQWAKAETIFKRATGATGAAWLRARYRNRRRHCKLRLKRHADGAELLAELVRYHSQAYLEGHVALPVWTPAVATDLAAIEAEDIRGNDAMFMSRAIRALLTARAGNQARAERLMSSLGAQKGAAYETLAALVTARLALLKNDTTGALRALDDAERIMTPGLRAQVYYWQGKAHDKARSDDRAWLAYIKAALLYEEQWQFAPECLARVIALSRKAGDGRDATALAKRLGARYAFSRFAESMGTK